MKKEKNDLQLSVSVTEDLYWGDFNESILSSSTGDHPSDSSPSSSERMLFIAVFIQALLDATKEPYAEEPVISKNNRRTATKWFSLPTCVTASTFEPICELAGINPDYARKYFDKVEKGETEFPHRRINVLINSSKE